MAQREGGRIGWLALGRLSDELLRPPCELIAVGKEYLRDRERTEYGDHRHGQGSEGWRDAGMLFVWS